MIGSHVSFPFDRQKSLMLRLSSSLQRLWRVKCAIDLMGALRTLAKVSATAREEKFLFDTVASSRVPATSSHVVWLRLAVVLDMWCIALMTAKST